MQWRRILYPTDFSEPSRHAYEIARMLAEQSGAELVALHVDAPVAATAPPAVVGFGHLPIQFTPQARVEQAAEVLARVFPSDERVQIRHSVVSGDPAQTILDAAAAEQADLIVMGTHGHTGLARLLMGSVAETVVRQAPCPVLTLREKPVPAEAAPKGPTRAAKKT